MGVRSFAAVCGTGLLAALLTGCGGNSVTTMAKIPVPATPPVKEKKPGLDGDLEEFGHEYLPQVEAALAELKHEVEKRSAALTELEKELKRLNRGDEKSEWTSGKYATSFVTKDETHARWKATIEKLVTSLEALKEQRKEAYLAFRKFQIAQGTGDGLHKKRFDEANAAAAASQKVYQDALREFEGR